MQRDDDVRSSCFASLDVLRDLGRRRVEGGFRYAYRAGAIEQPAERRALSGT